MCLNYDTFVLLDFNFPFLLFWIQNDILKNTDSQVAIIWDEFDNRVIFFTLFILYNHITLNSIFTFGSQILVTLYDN